MTCIIAGTGHRPSKLAHPDICYSERVLERLTALCVAYLKRSSATEIVTGMALGFDTAYCIAGLDLGLHVTAAVPFKGQELTWKRSDRQRYSDLLSRCDRVVVVCEGNYHPSKMHRRNEWMVSGCHKVLALYDGIPGGGTGACVEYAIRNGKPIDNIWKSWVKYSGV
jgi:uncharacterized phage-like protein YoqJ